MKFTPQRVLPAADASGGILVAGVDDTGAARNVTLRDPDPAEGQPAVTVIQDLRAQLLATPPMIPNPAYVTLAEQAFVAAVTAAEAQ